MWAANERGDMKTYKLKRNVTQIEYPWLGRNYKQDKVVYNYEKCTYGCIESGIAVTIIPDEEPFFELPIDSLIRI